MIDILRRIRVHPVFWAIIALGVATGYFRELMMLFCIVLCHELGHALAANHFGWRIRKIELLPFGGVAETEEYGNRPSFEEFIVIIAGPVQHVFLIALSYIGLSFLPFWSYADHSVFVFHNLTILIFNLLPVLPLDGGRIIQLVYAAIKPYREAQKLSLMTSVVILTVCMTLTAMYYPLHLQWWVIIVFLIVANFLEWKQQPYGYQRFLLERRLREPKQKSIVQVVPASLDISSALRRLYKGRNTIYHLEGNGNYINEAEVLQYWFYSKNKNAPLKMVLDP